MSSTSPNARRPHPEQQHVHISASEPSKPSPDIALIVRRHTKPRLTCAGPEPLGRTRATLLAEPSPASSGRIPDMAVFMCTRGASGTSKASISLAATLKADSC